MQRRRKKSGSNILHGWSILTGIIAGLVFSGLGIFLVLLLKLLPWGNSERLSLFSEEDRAVYSSNRYLFYMVLILYFLILVLFVFLLIIRRKAQDYGILFGCSLGSIVIPVVTSCLLGTGGFEPFRTLHSMILSLELYTASPEAAGIPLVLNTLLQCLILVVPGLLAFTIFLICYFICKRAHEDEYERPRKQNYYYI